MNERFKELSIKAGFPDWSSHAIEFELEVFAELIVKETMQIVANQLPSNQYLDVADAVIEHFAE